jgi:hypothetical protein
MERGPMILDYVALVILIAIRTDRSQLSNIAEQARTEMGAETLDVVADRGYYDSQEILACETVGITVT